MSNPKCNQCGIINFATAANCRRCGIALHSLKQSFGSEFSTHQPSAYVNSEVYANPEDILLVEYMRSKDNPVAMTGSSHLPMGKLILTASQLMFLSSGKDTQMKEAMIASMFGIWGMMYSTKKEMEYIREATDGLSLSALSNKGSWVYDLNCVTSCEIAGGVWQRMHLRVEAVSKNYQFVHALYRVDMKRRQWMEIKSFIDMAKNKARRR